jgi:uncharacterized membrane protein YesL
MREEAEKWASLILANLFWIGFALLVITLPAATAGAFAAVSEVSRGEEPHFFETFFGAMRRLWRKATAAGLLDLLLGGLIALNLWIFGRMGSLDVMAFLARSVTFFVALVVLLTNLYLWPLLIISDKPLRALIETALQLAFAHPLRSIGVLIGAAVPVVASLWLPRAFFLIISISGCMFIISRGTWPVIQQHIPEAAPSDL